MSHVVSTDCVTREDRKLRPHRDPDKRVRIAEGKRNQKWRDLKNHQSKPQGKPRSARLH